AVGRDGRLDLVIGAAGDLGDAGAVREDAEDVEIGPDTGVAVANAVAGKIDVPLVGRPVGILILGGSGDNGVPLGRILARQQDGLAGNAHIAGRAGPAEEVARQRPARDRRRYRRQVTHKLMLYAGRDGYRRTGPVLLGQGRAAGSKE